MARKLVVEVELRSDFQSCCRPVRGLGGFRNPICRFPPAAICCRHFLARKLVVEVELRSDFQSCCRPVRGLGGSRNPICGFTPAAICCRHFVARKLVVEVDFEVEVEVEVEKTNVKGQGACRNKPSAVCESIFCVLEREKLRLNFLANIFTCVTSRTG